MNKVKRYEKILYLSLIICSIWTILLGFLLFAVNYFRIIFFRSYFDRKFAIIFVMPIVLYMIYCGFRGFIAGIKKKNLQKLKVCVFIALILNTISSVYNIFHGGKVLTNLSDILPLLFILIISYFLQKLTMENYDKLENHREKGNTL